MPTTEDGFKYSWITGFLATPIVIFLLFFIAIVGYIWSKIEKEMEFVKKYETEN